MVLFFSGTGNSRYAAEGVAQVTEDRCVSINEYTRAGGRGEFFSEKPYVFVCPTYAWRYPRVVESFIKSSGFSGCTKAYFIQTCGGSVANSAHFARKLLTECGFEYMGFGSVVMPDNYLVMFDTDTIETADAMIAAADGPIRELGKKIAAGERLEDFPVSLGERLMSRLFNPSLYTFGITAKKFRVTDKCTGCGLCVKRCPLSNISMSDGKPVWGGRCTHCMACICGCGEGAVEFGKKTEGRNRLFNHRTPKLK